jgi:hypothetical protein
VGLIKNWERQGAAADQELGAKIWELMEELEGGSSEYN